MIRSDSGVAHRLSLSARVVSAGDSQVKAKRQGQKRLWRMQNPPCSQTRKARQKRAARAFIASREVVGATILRRVWSPDLIGQSDGSDSKTATARIAGRDAKRNIIRVLINQAPPSPDSSTTDTGAKGLVHLSWRKDGVYWPDRASDGSARNRDCALNPRRHRRRCHRRSDRPHHGVGGPDRPTAFGTCHWRRVALRASRARSPGRSISR